MERFAIFAPPFPSHIRALEALASQLIDCGHEVFWIHQAEVQQFLEDRRIRFKTVGATSHPAGSLELMLARAANPGSLPGLRRVIDDIAANTDMLCREGPDLLKNLGITVVIADQMEAAGGLLAQGARLAYISVACALPVNREPAIPLPVMHWSYASTKLALELNKTSSRVYDWLMKPHATVIAAHSKNFGLPPRLTLEDCLSPLAQLSQTTAAFDFPRTNLPAHFFHVGPLRRQSKSVNAFNIQPDPQRPFVFASFGTLQGGRFELFMRLTQACKALKLQLMVAHCNLLSRTQEQQLRGAGATWVTGFTDQQAAIEKADVVVTHGGLNTTLDALAAGTPLLVLPIAFDQPGVASRITYAKAGLKLSPRWASERAISTALKRLVNEPEFAQQAHRLGLSIAQAGGAAKAARLVLSAIANGLTVKSAAAPQSFVQFAERQIYAT